MNCNLESQALVGAETIAKHILGNLLGGAELAYLGFVTLLHSVVDRC